jgi:hypothetical protein
MAASTKAPMSPDPTTKTIAQPVSSGLASKTAAALKPSRLVTSPEKPISAPRPRNLIPSELRTVCKAMAAPASAGNKIAAMFKLGLLGRRPTGSTVVEARSD